MSKRLDEKLGVTRIILERLSEGEMRWSSLFKATLRESPSPYQTQTAIDWLLRRGYIERPSRGIYRITEKGRLFLKSLMDEETNLTS